MSALTAAGTAAAPPASIQPITAVGVSESSDCAGCRQALGPDASVVSFGSSLFHVDCFRCARCKVPVSHETNLLLLPDGAALCGNCSYLCTTCSLAIEDEAIIHGSNAWHAECFRCRLCKKRIADLVFARSSAGVYCMDCHSKRMAKSRQQAQAGGSASGHSSANGRSSRKSTLFPTPPDLSMGSGPIDRTRQHVSMNNLTTTREPSSGPGTGASSPNASSVQSPISASFSHPPRPDGTSGLSDLANGLTKARVSPTLEALAPPRSNAAARRQSSLGALMAHSHNLTDANAPQVENHLFESNGKALSPAHSRQSSISSERSEKAVRRETSMHLPVLALEGMGDTSARSSPLRASLTESGLPHSPTTSNLLESAEQSTPVPHRRPHQPGSQARDLPHMTFSMADEDIASILAYADENIANLQNMTPKQDPRIKTLPFTPRESSSGYKMNSGNAVESGQSPKSPRSQSVDDGLMSKVGEDIGGSVSSTTGSNSMPIIPPVTNDVADLSESDARSTLHDEKSNKLNVADLSSELAITKSKLRDMEIAFKNIKRMSFQLHSTLDEARKEYEMQCSARTEMQDTVDVLHVQLAQTAHLSGSSFSATKMDRRKTMIALQEQVANLQAERIVLAAELDQLLQIRDASHGKDDALAAFAQQIHSIKEQSRIEIKELQMEITELQTKRRQLQRELVNDAPLPPQPDTTGPTDTSSAVREESGIRRHDTLSAASANRLPLTRQVSDETLKSRTWLSSGTLTGEEAKRDKSSPKKFKWKNLTGAQGEREKAAMSLPKEGSSGRRSPSSLSSGGALSPQSTPNVSGHHFVNISGLRPSKCAHCHERVWGREMKCTGCGIYAHAKCIPNMSDRCEQLLSPPDFPNLPKDLTLSSVLEGRLVPRLVTRCIAIVEESSMEMEGIYRRSGSTTEIAIVANILANGNDGEQSRLKDHDICAITSTLKQFLRELDDPLCTFGLHDEFIKAALSTSDRKLEVLASLLEQLPEANLAVLRTLIIHLQRVTKYPSNLMTSRNLGVVFGPTLMRSSELHRQLLDMQGSAACIDALISNAHVLFHNQ